VYDNIRDFLEQSCKAIEPQFKIQHDFGIGYEEYIRTSNSVTPSALIVSDGFTSAGQFESGATSEFNENYRIIINVKRERNSEKLLIALRDQLNIGEVNTADFVYSVQVLDGIWLPADRALNTFEIRLQFLCLQ
jgi:hypothetical protein